MKYIIHKNHTNNSVTVIIPSGELSIEEVLIKDCPKDAFIVDKSDLPNFDEFFDAWELNNKTVSVNINKAKEITKKRLRIERKELLEEQDILFQRNLENNIDNSIVISEKQRLRDITKLVDETNTLEELKKIKVSKE